MSDNGSKTFVKWGIDFVGFINPPDHNAHEEYIRVATNYLKKGIEAKAIVKNNANKTTKFLYEQVSMRYDLPIEIVSNQRVHFINDVVEFLLVEFMVIHKQSTLYHP